MLMNDFSKRKGLLNSLIVSVYRIHYGGAEQHVVYFDNAWGGGLHMLKRVLIHKIQSQKNYQVSTSTRSIGAEPKSKIDNSSLLVKPQVLEGGIRKNSANNRSHRDCNYAVNNEKNNALKKVGIIGTSSAYPNSGENLRNSHDYVAIKSTKASHKEEIPNQDIGFEVEECLKRLFIVRCKNSFQFLVTLGTLFHNSIIRAADSLAMVTFCVAVGNIKSFYVCHH